MIFRNGVEIGDPMRNWSIVWRRGEVADNAFGFFVSGDDIWQPVILRDPSGDRSYSCFSMTWREQSWYEQCFWRCFRVRDDVPPDTYDLMLNGHNIGKLIVNEPRRRRRVVLHGRIERLTMEANTIYDARTAAMTEIVVAPDSELIGGVVTDGWMRVDTSISPGSSAAGLIVRDTRFVRCTVGGMVDWRRPDHYADHEALYLHCRFDHSTVTGCCSGAFIGCRWQGLQAGSTVHQGHAFVNERAMRLALIGCVFDGTDRGPILRTHWGPSCDNLYAGIRVIHCEGVVNANEVLCVESDAHSFDRNLIFGLSALHCDNHAQIWDTPADDNLFAHCRLSAPTTIHLSGIRPQRRNEIRYSRLAVPVILNSLGPHAVDTILRDNSTM